MLTAMSRVLACDKSVFSTRMQCVRVCVEHALAHFPTFYSRIVQSGERRFQNPSTYISLKCVCVRMRKRQRQHECRKSRAAVTRSSSGIIVRTDARLGTFMLREKCVRGGETATMRMRR